MIASMLRALLFCALVAASNPQSFQHSSFSPNSVMATTVTGSIFGNNNATYGTVPREEQLFSVEFLEVAPTPLPVDQFFFIFLRGWVPNEKELDQAKLRLTAGAKLASGKVDEPQSITLPLATATFADSAHIAIRNGPGLYQAHLSPGRNDILADFEIPGMFLRTGLWSFQVEGLLADGRCLFDYKLTQWLEGGLN